MSGTRVEPPVVRPLERGDWAGVAGIFADGIRSGDATFESDVPTWASWHRHHLLEHRFVAVERPERLLGWVALSVANPRRVYRGVAEVSVYVAEHARGQGIGAALLAAVVASSEDGGIWTLQAGVFPENAASLAVHRRAGFRVVGRRERIGLMPCGPRAGTWRDVLLLERRSTVVGT